MVGRDTLTSLDMNNSLKGRDGDPLGSAEGPKLEVDPAKPLSSRPLFVAFRDVKKKSNASHEAACSQQ